MTVTVEVTGRVVDDETGVWCPACLLPSAVRVVIAVWVRRTLSVVGWVTVTRCDDCGLEIEGDGS